MSDLASDLFNHFCGVMDTACAACPSGGKAFVVAFSGGADSTALCHMAARWAACRQAKGQAAHIHAVTVDHGLRAESAQEARAAGAAVARFAALSHHILTLEWPQGTPEQKIMEQARKARYEALAKFCTEYGVSGVLLGHHRDDQAETVLFRLAKGSGLDGLGGMRPVQKLAYAEVWLVRPLLECGHDDLAAYCAAHGLQWMEDPTNGDAEYARPRLRGAREVLEREGLSAKRLAVTAGRLARAAAALDVWAQSVFEAAVRERTPGRIVLDWDMLAAEPEEITLRCLQKAMEAAGPQRVYAARLERLETLCARMRGAGFRRACLGGCIFGLTRGKDRAGPQRILSVSLEKKRKT